MNHTMAAADLNPSSGIANAGTSASGANGAASTALTPQSVAQLNAQIHSLHQAGGGSTQINLHPASLGAIQIQVQMQGTHQAQVTFNAAQTAAAQAIQASLPQLASAMQQHGIQLSQPQVNTGSDAGSGQTPNSGQQPGQNPAGQQSQGQPSQGQQQHSQPRQPMTALAAGEVGRRSAPDQTTQPSRPGVRAYA
ncbi:flagellar hook-length control protein FliK [Salinisphaera sp. RV14]